MRSAQLTTSPSGVAGAGRDQLWLAMPSTVSAHRLRRGEGDQRPPRRMVEPAGHVGVERVLAGVPARPVPAVVPEGDRLGEGHVEPAGPGDRRGDLCDLERVGQAGALVVLRGRRRPGSCRPGGGTTAACKMRSRSRSKQVRQGSGVLGLGPVAGVPSERVAPGRQKRVLEVLGALPACGRRGRWRPGSVRPGSESGAGPMRACESAWARRTGPE